MTQGSVCLMGGLNSEGWPLARLLADEGYRVIGLSWANEKWRNHRAEDGVELISLKRGEEKIREIVQGVIDRYDRIHLLLYDFDHQLKKDQSVIRKGDSLWRETLRPACLLIEAVLPHMQEAGYGRLIHLIRHSWLGAPDAVPFSMSQGAVISLTRSLALKHAADGITVNCLVKGVLGKAQQERERRLQQVQPIPRAGEVADLVHAVSFLGQAENQYVTGQVLYVCGGLSLYSSLSV